MLNQFSRKTGRSEQMSDESLSNILKVWPGIEPGADFENAVWRRLKCASDSKPGSAVFELDWQRWAWPALAAAFAGIVLGATTASILYQKPMRHSSEYVILGERTLAGSYVMLAGEAGR